MMTRRKLCGLFLHNLSMEPPTNGIWSHWNTIKKTISYEVKVTRIIHGWTNLFRTETTWTHVWYCHTTNAATCDLSQRFVMNASRPHTVMSRKRLKQVDESNMRHFPIHSARSRRKQYVSCHDVAILQVQSLSQFRFGSTSKRTMPNGQAIHWEYIQWRTIRHLATVA